MGRDTIRAQPSVAAPRIVYQVWAVLKAHMDIVSRGVEVTSKGCLFKGCLTHISPIDVVARDLMYSGRPQAEGIRPFLELRRTSVNQVRRIHGLSRDPDPHLPVVLVLNSVPGPTIRRMLLIELSKRGGAALDATL